MVGYATRTLPLTPGTFNHVDFALEAVEFGIGQVVITPGENPAYPILDGVIRNKPLNDPERYDTYSCRTYTKMELDLTNIRPQFRSRRLQRTSGSSSITSTPRRSRPGLSPGDDLRVHGRPLPQQPSGSSAM